VLAQQRACGSASHQLYRHNGPRQSLAGNWRGPFRNRGRKRSEIERMCAERSAFTREGRRLIAVAAAVPLLAAVLRAPVVLVAAAMALGSGRIGDEPLTAAQTRREPAGHHHGQQEAGQDGRP